MFRRSEAGVTGLLAAGADPGLGEPSARAIATFFKLDDMLTLLETLPTRSIGPSSGGRP